MKIVKHGDPEAINALDYKLECHNCGAIFLFNHTEILSQERRFPGEATVRCPECNQIIYFMPEEALYDASSPLYISTASNYSNNQSTASNRSNNLSTVSDIYHHVY